MNNSNQPSDSILGNQLQIKLEELGDWDSFDEFINRRPESKLNETIRASKTKSAAPPIIRIRPMGVPNSDLEYWEAQALGEQLLEHVNLERYGETTDNHRDISRTPRLTVVYFANLSLSSKWESIFKAQMAELFLSLRTIKATLVAKVIICLNSPVKEVSIATSICHELLELNECSASISLEIRHNSIECYEWFGIHTVWKESRSLPLQDHYICYFHGKGMSTLDNRSGQRAFGEVFATESIVSRLKRNISILASLNFVDRIGLAASPAGFMWYNFWIARASYLARNEEPKLSPQYRYYYEAWLALNHLYCDMQFYDPRRLIGCFNLVCTGSSCPVNIAASLEAHLFNAYVRSVELSKL